MGYNNKLLLEGEKENIISMYFPEKLLSLNENQYVITDWLSPDDKYFIFLDELYDLTTKTNLGDIWENFDNLKIFLKHSFEVATNVPKEIKESVLNSINKLVITESTSDINQIKPLLRQFVLEQESFASWVGSGLKKAGNWLVDSGKEFGKTVVDTGKGVVKGVNQAVSAISKGDWSEVFNILGKGLIFLARKLRSLLYNPVGMILDAILIGTGIGKSVQWVPWAIVVALDLYEMVSGDYEDKDSPPWLRLLMFGCDILGLLFAGGVAGGARAAFQVFKGAKGADEIAQIALKNPNTMSLIKKIVGGISKVPELLRKAAAYLKTTKMAKAAPWIENILTRGESFLVKSTESLNNIIKRASSAPKVQKTVTPIGQRVKSGLKHGATTAGVVTGLDVGIKKGMQLYSGKTDKQIEDDERMAQMDKDYKAEYGMSIADKINKSFDE
jgi:hypothetical protein